ncbi:MAG TPA: glycosyltransferase, partial [Solirubrobacteraceae bacterium]|nr:glycosyltransferase [Solirubrobacteraceae bacterium]
MIVFASSITSPETYERCAEPGIRLASEPDSEVFAYQAAGSIFRSYNLILDQAAALDDLEALVLVHQDAEIADPDFCRKLRGALSDPEVGVVGCVGAVGVRSIAWWEGSVTWASFTHRYEEMGGGELPALSWKTDELPAFAQTGEVDTVDGFVLALSPWTVRNVRFDE